VFEICLETTRTVILAILVVYFWFVGRRPKGEPKHEGRWFVLGGSSLLGFGSVLDLTGDFAKWSGHEHLLRVSNSYQEIHLVEVTLTAGLVLLLIGCRKWLPSVVDLRHKEKILEQTEKLVAELNATQVALEFRATHDALTDLWNRPGVIDILEKELSRLKREGTSLGIILADIDHFKRINDAHGHFAGDAALKEIAVRIKDSVRPYDSVGRYGGEEFLVVMPGCTQEEAMQAAERLRLAFHDRPLETSEGRFNTTISLGVVSADGRADLDLETLIRAADKALYRAKHAGRNRVEL